MMYSTVFMYGLDGRLSPLSYNRVCRVSNTYLEISLLALGSIQISTFFAVSSEGGVTQWYLYPPLSVPVLFCTEAVDFPAFTCVFLT